MVTNQKVAGIDRKVLFSSLWTVVMVNMIFADILSFMAPGSLAEIINGEMDVQITEGLLLVFAIILEIPMVMIVLSRVLKYGLNRWVNVIASVITIAFIIGGGSAYPHYIFFAAVQTICMLIIIWFAIKWPKPE